MLLATLNKGVNITKDLMRLLQRAKEEGWNSTLTNGGHIKAQHVSGPIVIISGSASDWRALKNIECDLRRALRTASTRRLP